MSYSISDYGHIRVGEPVKVFMGSGWQKGTLIEKHRDGTVTVKLPTRLIRVGDPRNVKS